MELIEEIKELKEYKENNDLTIAELARKIEADDTTVGRWLKGEVTPNFYSLHKVRNFLNDIKNSEDLKPLENFRDKVTREREQKELDINYLKQRIKALNDVEDLDTLVTELDVTTQLGKLVRDAHRTPF
ncbi:helix-turn-helix transcriptional regulator [Ligilactobacillus salivarius]|uniref:Helix-turn-helix transcriptional regulator n=1 Tax=Ligilactobacillus salivarius TaxID=1624 RepID=A0ABD7YT29_9LACO|nr:helix-turn-helix transcriptional regulator [Ligilactobacillus salivarius]WHS06291.1 helix-turn-helix transcriptional regulator [Ligilactobacillus salivarius]WHS07626.1 helix-turn-helix transcriptional regulator [Ligilactobacillus salivarius]WHS10210.1 helix-turn-helix transcriptional regulator [Ligilactobacillus salivarius]WHS14147.1 helix-turn-helix transcriptional regulator [Ligilactobacillus salivarius]WHS17237.1 helix-turn-helix transcriptional regulator [Ligilactobacillus salivarius]